MAPVSSALVRDGGEVVHRRATQEPGRAVVHVGGSDPRGDEVLDVMVVEPHGASYQGDV